MVDDLDDCFPNGGLSPSVGRLKRQHGVKLIGLCLEGQWLGVVILEIPSSIAKWGIGMVFGIIRYKALVVDAQINCQLFNTADAGLTSDVAIFPLTHIFNFRSGSVEAKVNSFLARVGVAYSTWRVRKRLKLQKKWIV